MAANCGVKKLKKNGGKGLGLLALDWRGNGKIDVICWMADCWLEMKSNWPWYLQAVGMKWKAARGVLLPFAQLLVWLCVNGCKNWKIKSRLNSHYVFVLIGRSKNEWKMGEGWTLDDDWLGMEKFNYCFLWLFSVWIILFG